MMQLLHSIMRITWMDKVTNKEILERTGLPSMADLLIRKNLQWIRHLMRMSPDRLPKQVLYCQLSSGHRKRGRPRLRFKDTIKRNLKMREIKIDSWTSLSQQRDKWRARVKWWKQSLSHRDRQHDDDDISTHFDHFDHRPWPFSGTVSSLFARWHGGKIVSQSCSWNVDVSRHLLVVY